MRFTKCFELEILFCMNLKYSFHNNNNNNNNTDVSSYGNMYSVVWNAVIGCHASSFSLHVKPICR